MKKKISLGRIIGAVLIICLGTVAMWYVIKINGNNITEAEQRTESDFVQKKFTINEIWYREIEQNYSKIKYVFIKPENENINLSFGMDKIFTESNENDYEQFADQFKKGDEIEVKVYKPELDKAEDKSLGRKITNFISNNNNEVEMYELDLNGREIYKQDIHNTAVNFRSGGDLSVGRLFIAGLVILIPIASLIGYFNRRKQKRIIGGKPN